MLARPASNGARRLIPAALIAAMLVVTAGGALAASATGLTVTTGPRPVQASFVCPTLDPVPQPEPTSIVCA